MRLSVSRDHPAYVGRAYEVVNPLRLAEPADLQPDPWVRNHDVAHHLHLAPAARGIRHSTSASITSAPSRTALSDTASTDSAGTTGATADAVGNVDRRVRLGLGAITDIGSPHALIALSPAEKVPSPTVAAGVAFEVVAGIWAERRG